MKTFGCLAIIVAFSFTTLSAQVTVTVDTDLDIVDPSDGLLSLREAVDSVNTLTGKQIINFDSVYFNLAANRVIYLRSTLELNDTSGTDITGDGAYVVIDGSNPDTSQADTLDGFRLTGGNDSFIKLTIQNFMRDGISISGASNVSIADNNFYGNGKRGVFVKARIDSGLTDTTYHNPAGIFIVRNSFERNTEDGIGFKDVRELIINDNVIQFSWYGIRGDGIFDFAAAGLDSSQRGDFIISNNTLSTSPSESGDGIEIDYAANVTIEGNIITRFIYGIDLNKVLNTRIKYNRIHIMSGRGIESLSTDYAEVYQNDLQNIDNWGIYVTDRNGFVTQAHVYKNHLNTIDNWGIYVWRIDSLWVNDNVLEKIANWAIYTTGKSDSTGYHNISGNTLNAIDNYGIYTSNFGRLEIIDNHIENTHNYAIYVRNAKVIEILNNDVIDPDNYGIYASSADTIRAINNKVINAYNYGIYLTSRDLLEASNNFVTGAYNYGFNLRSASIGGAKGWITNNHVTHSRSTGFQINNFQELHFEHNVAHENSDGNVSISSINKAYLYNNELKISDNNGFNLSGIDSLWMGGNVAAFSQDAGLYIFGGSFADISDNDFDGNLGTGAYISGVDSLLFTHNNMSLNADDGVEIINSNYAFVGNNVIMENGMSGIDLLAVTNIVADSNYVADNGIGLSISTSFTSALITDNSFTGNNFAGVQNNTTIDSVEAIMKLLGAREWSDRERHGSPGYRQRR